jgi:uncharacterized protein YabE (DUF348 family)
MEQQPGGPARFLTPQHLVAAIVVVAIIVSSVIGYVWAQKGVTVVVDGERHFVRTQSDTVGELLGSQGIPFDEADLVSPCPDAELCDGSTVIVRRAVPVTVACANEPVEVDVIGSTVADALIAAGVDVGNGVQTEPALGEPLAPGMTIDVADVYVRVLHEETEVSFETTTTEDPTLPEGTRALLTQGVPGTMLSIFRVVVTDGVEGERELVTQRVVDEAVDEVIGLGSRRQSARTVASRAQIRPKAPVGGTTIEVEATGYAPNVDGVGTITATGDRAGYGIIAVDPRVIPLGTKLHVPGYGYGVAADTGGAIKGNRIDLCYDTGPEAIQWGRRNVTITIVQ